MSRNFLRRAFLSSAGDGFDDWRASAQRRLDQLDDERRLMTTPAASGLRLVALAHPAFALQADSALLAAGGTEFASTVGGMLYDARGFVGAVLFAFSHFIMARSLGHVNVSFVWHLPLLIVLTLWLARLEAVPPRRAQVAAAALLVATGLQNPYYPPLAFQLVALATLRSFLLRRNKVALFSASLLGKSLEPRGSRTR